MKRTIILSMAALVSFAACQKENTPAQQETKTTVLSATVEQQTGDTKTALGSGNTVVWSENDSVQVWNGVTGTNTPFVLTEGAGTTQGVFTGDEIDNPQYAFYPSSAVTGVSGSEVTFTIPATQNYVINSFDNGANFAVAKISGSNMEFKNICGVIKLQLKGTAKVRKIEVAGKNNEKLNGAYTVNAADTTPNIELLTTSVESEKTVVLDCGLLGVQLDPSTVTNFYVVVPKGSFLTGIVVNVFEKFGNSEINRISSTTINRNTILSMPPKSIIMRGNILPGEFSVSNTSKIQFAAGNLQVMVNANGDPVSWRLADRQYDLLKNGGSNIKIGVSEGYVDMFGYSTDGVGAGSGYKEWGVNASSNSADYKGSFVDWGTNTDIQSAIGEFWRTVTLEEFNYLTKSRTKANGSASTVGTETDARYAYIIVANIQGVLLFPDSFSWDTTEMGTVPTELNTPCSNYNDVNYSINQFMAMEDAGCVFLPCTGEIMGNSYYNPYNGCYHFSNGSLKFNYSKLGTGSINMSYAQWKRCVRLVKNVQK